MKPIPSFSFEPATEEMAVSVGERMCEGDARECRLMSGSEPVEAILAAIRNMQLTDDKCLACVINGQPEMIFGIKRESYLSDVGIVWMLHTDVPENWGLMFAKYSRKALMDLFEESECRMISNFVLAENLRTVRWLMWLGFKFDVHFIKEGHKWLHFYMTKGADDGRSGRA